MAGRLVLIKSVLQAMPLYLFSILAAPKWVLKAIRNLQRNFLWGSTGLNRKWALVNWKEVCKTKSEGGLGFGIRFKATTQWEHECGGTGSPSLTHHGLNYGKQNMPWAVNGMISSESIPQPKDHHLEQCKTHSSFIQEHSFWEIHSGKQQGSGRIHGSNSQTGKFIPKPSLASSYEARKPHWFINSGNNPAS
jgi:hypothetical protein